MPFLDNFDLQQQPSFEYLKNVYSSILLKDVVARENIRNVAFLENLVIYLIDNVGNLFSAANISKYLKSQKNKYAHTNRTQLPAGPEQRFLCTPPGG